MKKSDEYREEKKMYAKIEITGMIELCTGMHIGGSSAFSAIGAVDSPVVRDALSDKTMIPGSSLKGKMRYLLARQYNGMRTVKRHDQDDEKILRLFGSSAEGQHRSRLIFSDMILSNAEELHSYGLTSVTEVKFENTINRLTAEANPRQIERAVRGSKYDLSLIYDVEKIEEVEEDFKLLADGMKLLQYDYLGGSGSRGYGKVKFKDLYADVVIGEVDDATLEACRQCLEQVEK